MFVHRCLAFEFIVMVSFRSLLLKYDPPSIVVFFPLPLAGTETNKGVLDQKGGGLHHTDSRS